MRLLFLFLCTVLAALFSHAAWAQSLETQDFAKIPVMHEGRIKPMDSFARATLKELSGHDDHALMWLIETMFNPTRGENNRVIKVVNPDVLNTLGLDRRKDKLYSYRELTAALAKKQEMVLSIVDTPEKDWSLAQRDLIDIQQKTVLLGDLLASLSLFVPLSVSVPADAPSALDDIKGKTLRFTDIYPVAEELQNTVKKIVQAKGQDLEQYSETEQALAHLSFIGAQLSAAGERSKILRVMPSYGAQEWLSPWVYYLSETDRKENKAIFGLWRDLAQSYYDQDEAAWQSAAASLYAGITAQAGEAANGKALAIEHFYNIAKPFHVSMFFYGCALLAMIGFMFVNASGLPRIAFGALSIGVILHGAAIIMRMYILSRPPVSTLYESIIFVGLVVVAYGLLAYRKDQNPLWLYLGAFLGCAVQILGFSHDSSTDNLMMLTAVLNTNFWLATHVICIVIGYGFCLVTSFLAHHSLIDAARKNYNAPDYMLFKNIHVAALMALLFSAVGTVLGGIWADQSWGRFWGWDPKENGALLIVLWLVWVLHGRISGQFNALWVQAGLAYLSVIVALSWFGVNLLSVGLHAYGFTDSQAIALVGFTAFETVLIGFLIWRIKRAA